MRKLLFFLALIVCAQPTQACMFFEYRTVEERENAAREIFSKSVLAAHVKLIDVQKDAGTDTNKITYKIIEAYKKDKQFDNNIVVVHLPYITSCDRTLPAIGSEYDELFFFDNYGRLDEKKFRSSDESENFRTKDFWFMVKDTEMEKK